MKTGCTSAEKSECKPDENRMKTKKKFKNAAKILVVQKISRNFATLFGQNEKQPRTLKDLQ